MRNTAPIHILTAVASLLVTADLARAVTVRASTIEGKAIEGAWLGMADGKIKLSVGGKTELLDPADMMKLGNVAATSGPAPAASAPGDGVVVHLADGSRFLARITATEGETIRLATSLVPELTLKLSSLAGLRFSQAEVPAAAAAFSESLANRDPTQDTLITVQDGKVNTLRVMLESLDADGGKFRWRDRNVAIERGRMFALVLATGAGAPALPPVRVRLAGGDVWSGRLIDGDERTLRLELTAGPTIALAVETIEDVLFRNDRVRFLSDLEPAQFEFTPWGTTRWPYRNDRSVAGRPMRIGGEVYDRGIGVHSATALTYRLEEPFQQFAALVGIDDAVGSRGSVVFRVLADGRELFNSGVVTGRDEAKPVLVDLKGAKTLQLAVDFGEELDVGDQANWASARLIK